MKKRVEYVDIVTCIERLRKLRLAVFVHLKFAARLHPLSAFELTEVEFVVECSLPKRPSDIPMTIIVVVQAKNAIMLHTLF